MSLELKNTTKNTIRIPDYNYNGTLVFEPEEAKPLDSIDKVSFFRPYARAGIIVRNNEEDLGLSQRTLYDINKAKEDLKGHVSNIADGVADSVKNVSDKTKDAIKSVADNAGKIVNDVVEDTVEEVTSKVDKVEKFTADFLDTLTLKELKATAKEVGVDADSVNKKADVKDMILSAQKKSK